MSGWVVFAWLVFVTITAWAVNDLRDDVRRLRERVKRVEERGGLPPGDDD